MTDLSRTIAPKSDQLNSDDLIGGPRTITITRVTACPDSSEQPVAVYFEGDNGKPYKPCKSMRRVMVHVWGKDGTAYPGRAMTIYRDEKVQFGGLAVGGIRISHMSHIDAPVTMALTATRANRKPYTVQPLKIAPAFDLGAFRAEAMGKAGEGTEAFRAWYAGLNKEQKAHLKPHMDEYAAAAKNADGSISPMTGTGNLATLDGLKADAQTVSTWGEWVRFIEAARADIEKLSPDERGVWDEFSDPLAKKLLAEDRAK